MLGTNNVTANGGAGQNSGGNGGGGRIRLEYAQNFVGITTPTASIWFDASSGNETQITNQPSMQTSYSGSNATFSVGFKALSPFFIQWFFNDVPLQSATNQSLDLTNLVLSQQGNYSVTISNAVMTAVSSNAFLTVLDSNDLDGDGIPNFWEQQHGLNPTNALDATTYPPAENLLRRLTYLQKFFYGLNPLTSDTDGDGLGDHDELFTYATNPLRTDTDGDGLPDGWEILNGLNPRFNDANADFDADGVSNLGEYTWSTNYPGQPLDPRRKFSTSATVSDFAVVTGTGTNQFFYDRNDRLIGAEYDRGLALAYVYDGNGNPIRQVMMLHDANNNGLPDVWEFLNGLTNNAGTFTDTDGDGWSDWQEWKSGTQPTNTASAPNLLGNPGTNIASLVLPFMPSNFVVGIGQLDGWGAEEIVLGADGNPGTNNNFLVVLTQGATTWSTQRVDVGSFGITSIAVGQPKNRPSVGIYIGLRGVTNGSGRVMEFTSNGGTWQSNVVALSRSQSAFVLGVREQDVLLSIATTNSLDGSLSSVSFTTNWSLSLLDTNSSRRGLGTLFQHQRQSNSTSSLRLLDSGGIVVASTQFSVLSANLVSYWKLDETSGDAADSVGSNALTNHNAVTYSAGLLNNAANFGNDGVFRSLRRAGSLGLTVDQAKTFSFWLKMNHDTDSNEEWPLQIGFYDGSTNTSGSVVFSYQGSTNNLYLNKGDNNGHNSRITHTITLGTNAWHHLVGTTDGTTWKLYVDGALVGTAPDYVNNGGNGTFSPAFFALGAIDRPNRFNIDEVGVWSRALSAGEVNLLFGNAYGVANLILPEPFVTRTNNWLGASLTSGFVRGTNGGSVFYTFGDDKNANGTIDFADDFVTAEYFLNGTNASLLTLSRQPIVSLTPAQSYGLASVNFLNRSTEVFFTGEPDGQVFAWTATGATNPLQRQLFSGHHVGKGWHALAGVKTFEPGESLIGLRVDPTNQSRCDVIHWSPQGELSQLVNLPNTAPASAVLPSTDVLAGSASVSVRLWDAEGNASTPLLQFKLSNSTNWQDATLTSLDGGTYSISTRVAASPGGVNHTVVWNALANVGANIVTNLLLRTRASDMLLLGDWSAPTPFQLNTALADNDGMDDSWEILYFGTTSHNGSEDSDGDYFTDLQEFMADTNPTNAASHLRMTGAFPIASGLRLEWQGGSSATQYLQRLSDLNTNLWQRIVTNFPPTPVSGSYTDAIGTDAPRFYRIEAIR